MAFQLFVIGLALVNLYDFPRSVDGANAYSLTITEVVDPTITPTQLQPLVAAGLCAPKVISLPFLLSLVRPSIDRMICSALDDHPPACRVLYIQRKRDGIVYDVQWRYDYRRVIQISK